MRQNIDENHNIIQAYTEAAYIRGWHTIKHYDALNESAWWQFSCHAKHRRLENVVCVFFFLLRLHSSVMRTIGLIWPKWMSTSGKWWRRRHRQQWQSDLCRERHLGIFGVYVSFVLSSNSLCALLVDVCYPGFNGGSKNIPFILLELLLS